MKDKLIIFFTRIPALGRTKTRLEPFLNKELCVDLQTAFIKDIYENIKDMEMDILVNYSEDGYLKVLKDILNDDLEFLRQEGKDLGEKMHNIISNSLKNYNKVVLIGSDIPLIGKKDIEMTFDMLKSKDIVISPTYDGGYYLIGMKEENREIFDMKYSTNSVFEETIAKINKMNKTYGIGNIQLDIDDKEDFLKLYEILKNDKNIYCENTRKLVWEIMGGCETYEEN